MNPGDNLVGAAGNDTLTVSISGTNTAAVTTSAITMSGIETLKVSNFQLGDTSDNTIDLAQATDIQAIVLEASASTGDTLFTNVRSIATAQMGNGAGDLSITYTDTAIAGTADTQVLTLSGQTAGNFTVNGIETLAITSSTTANALEISGGAIATVTATGDKALTLTEKTSDTLSTINASGMTAAFKITTDDTKDMAITGGSGNDTFVLAGTYNSADTINGGSGTDVLSVSITGTTADAAFTNVSNVETLTLTSSGGAVTLGAEAIEAGIVNINGSTTADTISATAYTVGITYTESGTVGADSIALGTGNDVFVFKGDLALSQNDTLDGNAGTDVIRIDNSAGSATISVDFDQVTDIEQIVVGDADGNTTGATGTAQDVSIVIGGLTATAGEVGVTSVTIDGSVITDASDALLITNSAASAGLTFSITGGAGNDSLAGASGNDTISGGAGTGFTEFETITVVAGSTASSDITLTLVNENVGSGEYINLHQCVCIN